jgi:hypothetical protein
LDEEGADYMSHGIASMVTHHFTERLHANLNGTIAYFDFTDINTNDFDTREANDLDRTDSSLGSAVYYRASEQVELNGTLGVSFSKFRKNRDLLRDSNETSLDFGLGALYTPDTSTNIQFQAQLPGILY